MAEISTLCKNKARRARERERNNDDDERNWAKLEESLMEARAFEMKTRTNEI